MGLVFGWLRSVDPTFGRIPEPALWIFDTVGLAVFIGIVGLNAGPILRPDFARPGRPGIRGVDCVGPAAPRLLLFGYHILRSDPVILVGTCPARERSPRPTRDPGRITKQAPSARVHRALRHRQQSLTAWGPVIMVLMQ